MRDTERVAVFIDGFTVYYGLKAKGWRHFYWLDYVALASRLLRSDQELVGTKYFTSRVREGDDSRARQVTYIEALAAHGGLEIVEGKYEVRPVRCPGCGHKWPKPKEKMTDVAIATHLMLDALDDLYDTAFLICADADLVPAVQAVRARFGKTVVVVSPPGRTSDELAKNASAHLHFQRRWIRDCQLPNPVLGDREYWRPEEWTAEADR